MYLRQIFAAAFALSVLGAADPALATETNPLRDPGFEKNLHARSGGWKLFGGRFTREHARSGAQSLRCSAFEGTAGAFQELPAKPGSKWRLTGYGMTPVKLQGVPAFGIIQLSFFDAKGEDLGTLETKGERFPARISNKIDAGTEPEAWIPLDTGVATAPPGTATVQAFALFVDHAFNLQGGALVPLEFQGVYFDDLELCALAAKSAAGAAPECRALDLDDAR